MVIPSQPSEPPPAADCGGLDGSRANARAQRSPEPGSEGGTSPKTRDVKLNPPGQEQMTQDSGCLAPVTNTGSSCEGGDGPGDSSVFQRRAVSFAMFLPSLSGRSTLFDYFALCELLNIFQQESRPARREHNPNDR